MVALLYALRFVMPCRRSGNSFIVRRQECRRSYMLWLKKSGRRPPIIAEKALSLQAEYNLSSNHHHANEIIPYDASDLELLVAPDLELLVASDLEPSVAPDVLTLSHAYPRFVALCRHVMGCRGPPHFQTAEDSPRARRRRCKGSRRGGRTEGHRTGGRAH